MTISDAQAEALELARLERHVANGEPGEIALLRRNQATGGLDPYDVVTHSWEYSDLDYRGIRLPPGVVHEMRISEKALPRTKVLRLAAFKHGDVTLQVIQPSPMAPSGDVRFWRFWLTPSQTD